MNPLHMLLPVALAFVALPAAGQSGAPAPADHAQHAAPAAGAAKPDHAAMHEKCKGMMGARMAGKQAHDHMRDKTGAAHGRRAAPPSKAEMEKMHAHCAQMMAKAQPKS